MSPGELRSALHPSLVRPILLGGAERELAVVNTVAILVLVLGVGPHPLTLMLAGLMGTAGHSTLVLAARFDPQMWRVYSRHLGYRTFYPARALHAAPAAPVRPFRLGA